MKLLSLMLLLISSISYAELRVAVIDTGLDLNDPRFQSVLCPTGHIDFTGSGIKDEYGHGTHVAGIIKNFAGDAKYCMVIYKIFRDGKSIQSLAMLAFKYASEAGVTMINFSAGGYQYEESEKDIIKNSPRTLYIVAGGNDSVNLDTAERKYYPASYGLPNIIPVGNLNNNYDRNPSSNYGSFLQWEVGTNIYSTLPNNKIGPMTGSSMSAAVRTGKLIRALHEGRIK